MGDIYINAESIQERAYKMRFAMRITEREIALINYLLTTASKANTLEIVRCGECIHHDDGLCHRPKWSFTVEPTDFCSYGERRNDE